MNQFIETRIRNVQSLRQFSLRESQRYEKFLLEHLTGMSRGAISGYQQCHAPQ